MEMGMVGAGLKSHQNIETKEYAILMLQAYKNVLDFIDDEENKQSAISQCCIIHIESLIIEENFEKYFREVKIELKKILNETK